MTLQYIDSETTFKFCMLNIIIYIIILHTLIFLTSKSVTLFAA